MTKFVDISKNQQEDLHKEQVSLSDLNIKLSLFICELLEELGVQDYYDNGSYVQSCAPCHGGDNPTGWTYFHDSGRWHCWTHKCHEEFGGNCIDLIKAIFDISLIEAVHKAADFVEHKNLDDQDVEKIKKQRANIKKKENYWKDHNEPRQVFSELTLKNLASAERFAKQRRLSLNMFSEYGIGYAYRGPLAKRIVIPVRNIREKIVGFTGRTLAANVKPKWMHWPTGENRFRTGINFFNIEKAFRYNAGNGRSDYILVEGPFDVIRMESAGVHNSMCTFGNGVRKGQIEILRQIGATKILIAYDADKAGRDGAKAAVRKLEKKLFSVGIIDLGKDFFPDWDSAKLGKLDWANPNISESLIKELIDNYDISNNRSL